MENKCLNNQKGVRNEELLGKSTNKPHKGASLKLTS
jgi:hypothetical protein